MEEQKKKGSGLGLLIVIIIVIVVAWFAFAKRGVAPSSDEAAQIQSPAAGEDTTAVIEAELQDVDLGNIDAELQAIDADLNQL
jgi:flagellar basal body-associated protein FliL